MADVIEVTQEEKDSMLLELVDVRNMKDYWSDVIDVKTKTERTELSACVSREAELVGEVLRVFFPDEKLEGVQKQNLGNGWSLKATFKKTTKIDNSKVEGVVAELQNMPSIKAEDIFPQVRKFAKRGYNDLHDSVKIVADKALIVKPSDHTVDIVAPKGVTE